MSNETETEPVGLPPVPSVTGHKSRIEVVRSTDPEAPAALAAMATAPVEPAAPPQPPPLAAEAAAEDVTPAGEEPAPKKRGRPRGSANAAVAATKPSNGKARASSAQALEAPVTVCKASARLVIKTKLPGEKRHFDRVIVGKGMTAKEVVKDFAAKLNAAYLSWEKQLSK